MRLFVDIVLFAISLLAYLKPEETDHRKAFQKVWKLGIWKALQKVRELGIQTVER